MPARPSATAVAKRLVEAGHIAYFAGGWVRDFLMKRSSDDIDIATSASVEQIQALFPKTIPVGVSFGIVIVVHGGFHFEVATFRKDRGYVDGRRPTGIDPATPAEDALRRDFTINGMFYDPLKEELFDFVGGREDIEKKIIRAIGDPHARFLEDRLRMMRAVRYSTRFDFPIEKQTVQAILDHANSLLPAVAMERIWQEFKKMSQFAHFDKGLETLHRLKLLPTIFPALKEITVEEMQERLRPLAFYPLKTPAIAELLELFPSYSLEQLFELCDYLKVSRQEKELVDVLHHAKQMMQMPAQWQKALEKIEWARFYAHPHAPLSLTIIAARFSPEKRERFLLEHQQRQEQLSSAIARIQSKNPIVKAEHLLAEGIPPSKKMGALLAEAERLSVNHAVENRDQIILLLKNTPLWHT